MVKNHISTVLKQAITTFTCKKELFSQNWDALRAVLDTTTAEDVNLHPQFMTESLWTVPNKAPVTYVDIFEDSVLSMGIFILKPGMKLPLHDHPHMYGLIKVIAGKIKVSSYSLRTDKTAIVDETQSSLFTSICHDVITAELTSDLIADSTSAACMLGPDASNLHEIESIGGPAAFIDILSPPYNTETPNNGVRKCSYYKVLDKVTSEVFKLQEISAPSWFWTDSFPYSGPELF